MHWHCIPNEKKWQQPWFILSHYQVQQPRIGLANYHLFNFGKGCHICSSVQFKLFVNSKFTDCFHFPILHHWQNFPLGLTRPSCFTCQLWKCQSCALRSGVPHVDFLLLRYILGGAPYIQKHPVVQKLWYSQSHAKLDSTAFSPLSPSKQKQQWHHIAFTIFGFLETFLNLSLIHISEPTRPP